MPVNKDCKHDQGFRFLACHCADRLPGVWACVAHDCDYCLNFDPGKFPSGIAYLSTPTGTKIMPKLSEAGKL